MDNRQTSYVVLYRMGGYADCTWIKLLDSFPSADAAVSQCNALERMGYHAIHRTVAEHDLLGMPIGWHYKAVDWEEDVHTVTTSSTRHVVATHRIPYVAQLMREMERVAA